MAETHPMRPIEFLILAILNDTDRHGYAMVKEIERRTGGRMQIKPGNLYRVIDRLFERGLLEHAESRPAPELEDERRNYYRITETGREALLAEARMLGAIVGGVLDPAGETAG